MQSLQPLATGLYEPVENNFELGRLYCDINAALFHDQPSQADVEGLEARWSRLRDQEPTESARATTDDCLEALRKRLG